MTEELKHMDASEISFLEDSPQPLSERDELSHKSLANRIVQAIRSCPTPYTIGLSGEWGSGKTSVAHYIRDELKRGEETPATIPVVYFDAWKYQRDSLRRQFLIEAHRQLKEAGFLNSTDLTDAELYETRSFQHSPEIDWKSVFPWQTEHWVASSFRIVIFLAGLAALGYALISPSSAATRLVAALLGGTGISAFLTLLPRLFVTGTPTDVKPPLTSAEEFGSKFIQWLTKGKLKGRRMLVIVDNVDRCDDAQIIELLGDIKTFLEPSDSKVIFLLPVDEGAVRRVLTQRYGTTDTANEFLRKFFNTLFRIPVPLAGETRSFASTKLRQTGLLAASGATEEELGKVVTVMTAAYPNNPRRVIQFLNRLSSQWLLLASTAEQLRRTEVASDLGAIAKGVAIRERWPDFASFLENSPLELAIVERQVVAGTDVFALTASGITSDVDAPAQLVGLAAFLRATRTITMGRPRLTLTGKADRFELELPDAELLRAYLRGEQQAPLSERLSEDVWTEACNAGNVSAFMMQELDDLWSAQQFEGVGLLLSVVGPSLEALPEQFRQDLADSMADKISRPAVTEALAKVRPEASIPIAEYSRLSKTNALSALPTLISQIDVAGRPAFAQAISEHAESLSEIKDAILAQKAVREDPVVIERLSLLDGKPNRFWNPTVALTACTKVVEGSDAAAFNRWLTPTRDLLQAVADDGQEVHQLVLQLLSNENSPEEDITFRWAARSPTVLQSSASTLQDLDPLRLRAEAVRDRGGQFTKIDYFALLARLKGMADAASVTTFTSELTTWMSSVPFDPSTELGDWFPNLGPWQFGLPNLLLTGPTATFNESEIKARLRFARQQGMSWTEVAYEIVQLCGTAASVERAMLLTEESIAENQGEFPDEFYPDVSNALLKQLYDGTTYQPSVLPLLKQIYRHHDGEEVTADEGRLAFRKTLLDAMNGGHARARTDYNELDFTRPEVERDIEAALETLKTRSITSSSVTLLSFLVEKPPSRIRSDLIKELEILATDATFWTLGLDALDKVEWSPGVQIAARISNTLATDAMVQRDSNPPRAIKDVDTALHMAKLARDRAPREEIERTIDALRLSEVINVDQAEALKTKLNEP